MTLQRRRRTERLLFKWVLFTVVTVLSLASVLNAFAFYCSASRVAGVVQSIHAINGDCKGRGCTRYWATVAFETSDRGSQTIGIPAGRMMGLNQPTAFAGLEINQRIDLLTDADGRGAVRDTFEDLWKWPLSFFAVGIVGLVSCWRYEINETPP